MSQQLQRTRGVLNKSLRLLMRSVLQVARGDGILDLSLALNVRRLARLARWRDFPGPLVNMPWLATMRPFPYQHTAGYVDERLYHGSPFRRLSTAPLEIEAD